MSKATANPPLPGAMPGRIPENARPPADFMPQEVAKTLLRATRTGTLATLDRNSGYPFASLVNVATDSDGAPLILVSRLATHTANLEVRRPRLAAAGRDRQRRCADASPPHRAGHVCAGRPRQCR